MQAQSALSIAARGGKADTAKPFKGVDGGVFEIALRHRGDAYRVIYAVQIREALWVIHAFQKKGSSLFRVGRGVFIRRGRAYRTKLEAEIEAAP